MNVCEQKIIIMMKMCSTLLFFKSWLGAIKTLQSALRIESVHHKNSFKDVLISLG